MVDINSEFDIGPLSWVQGEIDQSLARGLESLTAFSKTPGDLAPLQRARAHFRQAAGAIHMVGLDALVAYTDELERQLERLGAVSEPDVALIVTLIARASQKLRTFLEELVRSVPLVPLNIYSEYEAMQRSRGVKVCNPTDLFYPDLSVRVDDDGPRHDVSPERFAEFLIRERRTYQQGLLAWLRGDVLGAETMRGASENIEIATPQHAVRTFWWTVTALFDVVREEAVENTFTLKQLLARIDLQVRRLIDGSGSVAERLRRETLYFLAISAPVSERVQQVQERYRLASWIPADGDKSQEAKRNTLRVYQAMREAQGLVAEAKNLWLRLIAGQVDQFPRFRESLQSLCEKTALLAYPEIQPLIQAFLKGSDSLTVQGIPETIAMEYATGFLFVEDVFAQKGTPIEGLTEQTQAMQARVELALTGKPLPVLDLPRLLEFSQRAQDRMLLAQVAQDIQANLRYMEQELDIFFRDNSKLFGLVALDKSGREIGGALRMLGLNTANELLLTCMEQIAGYTASEVVFDHGDFELLAESLSGLGFYIEALEQQRSKSEELIAHLLVRQRQRIGIDPAVEAAVEGTDQTVREEGAAKKPEEVAAIAATALMAEILIPEETKPLEIETSEIGDVVAHVEPPLEAPSIEMAIEGEIRALQLLGHQLRQEPKAVALRQALGKKILALSDDAKLIGNAMLIDKIKTIQQKIEQNAFTELPMLLAALSETPQAEAPSAEVQRLLHVDAKQLDAELLEIYLQEAVEVLDGVHEHRELLMKNPRDHEALRTVRRAFHTLKGSGRMVGLTELGELAYEVEKIHNKLLEGGHLATPTVLAMMEVAERDFKNWVAALTADKIVNSDPAALYAVIDAVARELNPGAIIDTAGRLESVSPASMPAVQGAQKKSFLEGWELSGFLTPAAEDPQSEKTAVAEVFVTQGDVSKLPEIEKTVSEAAVVEAIEKNPEVSEDDDVRVGDVVLSQVLYGLFTGEAEQHWSALSHELGLMQIDPYHTPTLAMIRAAHTLAGIHLTAGFPVVAKVAKALELALIAVSEQRSDAVKGSSQAVPVVARAVYGLRVLIDRIQAKETFARVEIREAEAIEAEISVLYQQTTSGVDVSDAGSIELQQMQKEALSLGSAEISTAPEDRKEDVKQDALRHILQDLAIFPEAPALSSDERESEDDALLALRDEVDPQLLPLFLDEAAELYRKSGGLLRRIDNEGTRLELKRHLHTFKGSARMAGAMRLGELAHHMETRLAEEDAAGENYLEHLENDLDRIGYVLDKLRNGEVNVAWPWLEAGQVDEKAMTENREEPVSKTETLPSVTAMHPVSKKPMTAAPAPILSAQKVEEGQLRVAAARIDRLVNEAGEIIIARSRAEGELRVLKSDLLELTNSVIRLRSHVRVIEIEAESQIQAQLEQMQDLHGDFDPLEFDRYTRLQELTRSIAEGVNDVSTVQQALLAHLDTANAALLSQARLSRDVQQALFSIRTVPFSSVSERLYRILRSLSKELKKRANLEIKGAQNGLDRAVLEKLVGPLEHLLRNALDHGVETPNVRRMAGKSETAEITIAVRQAGNEIMITFSDDGAGLDPERLRRIALEKGFSAKDEELSDAKLFEMILQPGFTTSEKVTQVSGRGMGMDIVCNEVISLGGRVEVTSALGQGTTFTLYLPLTVAVAQTVLIRGTQHRSWAIPVTMVEHVEHVTENVLARMYETSEAERRGQHYPFYYFDRLVDREDTVPEIKRYNTVIFLRTGQGRVAIHIDQMLGNQEVVVKNVGTQLVRVAGLSGATILGNGEIALIVNPIQLSQRQHIPPFVATQGTLAARTQKLQEVAAKRVLIVDDSLTIRKVTTRLMTREGYAVETAKDGFDALQSVGERRPDVILLDIEMPRMDGFEFAKMMKADALTRDIPIIMITSRTANKHRTRALELGVDAYLGKPYQEDELLGHIRRALAPSLISS